MRSFLRSHQLTEAEEAGKQAIQAAPLLSLVHATYGDVNFTIGQMGVAEAEYRAALKLDANAARGLYGMGRMYSMVSMHKRAKEVFAKAHEADPKDSQIYEAWVASLPEAEQLEKVKAVVARLFGWKFWSAEAKSEIDRVLSDNKSTVKKWFKDHELTTGYLMGAPS